MNENNPASAPGKAQEATTPGEAAEAASAAAHQATTTTAPAEPPAAGVQPKLPPGQCQACGATVKREDIEHFPDKPACHRRKRNKADLIGDLCGPVVTVWVYHVAYARSDGRLRAGRVPCPIPMEQGNCLEITAKILSDTEGQPVEVLWWSLLMGA